MEKPTISLQIYIKIKCLFTKQQVKRQMSKRSDSMFTLIYYRIRDTRLMQLDVEKEHYAIQNVGWICHFWQTVILCLVNKRIHCKNFYRHWRSSKGTELFFFNSLHFGWWVKFLCKKLLLEYSWFTTFYFYCTGKWISYMYLLTFYFLSLFCHYRVHWVEFPYAIQ